MVGSQSIGEILSAPGDGWRVSRELVELMFKLEAVGSASIVPQYAVKLHAWFLDWRC